MKHWKLNKHTYDGFEQKYAYFDLCIMYDYIRHTRQIWSIYIDKIEEGESDK